MKRNKLVSIAAITVALGVLATGCAGGSGSSKSDSKSSGGTKTVILEIFIRSLQKDRMKKRGCFHMEERSFQKNKI